MRFLYILRVTDTVRVIAAAFGWFSVDTSGIFSPHVLDQWKKVSLSQKHEVSLYCRQSLILLI